MLRSATIGLCRHGYGRVGAGASTAAGSSRLAVSASNSSSCLLLIQRSIHLRSSSAAAAILTVQPHGLQYQRAFSSEANDKKKQQQKETKADGAEDADDTKEIVLTPGEQVVAASRLTMWAGIFGFACVCAYYIGRELFPTKMSPNSVFNGAVDKIRENGQIQRVYGDKLKFYGRDHGSHREGRRNFIEHNEYVDPEDGSKRTRVRFNMESQFATAFCFAEVSAEMPSGEFVYILVQDKRSGRVVTIVDNRASLRAKQLAGGNTQTANAMQQLLSGSGGNK